VNGRQRVQVALDQAGLTDRVRELSETARTAAEAAAALGCEVGAIGSSLVFMVDDKPVLVLTSGAHRVDLSLVGQHLSAASVRMATPSEVREVTGFAIGGVAPIGLASQLPVLVDEDLAGFEQVWCAAGHTHAVFSTTYAELLDVTGGQPVRVA
jgi:prolyl-tRNA editing enzyme YbaK/EbsC (Cys-tRNA(Pro) deacylase)